MGWFWRYPNAPADYPGQYQTWYNAPPSATTGPIAPPPPGYSATSPIPMTSQTQVETAVTVIDPKPEPQPVTEDVPFMAVGTNGDEELMGSFVPQPDLMDPGADLRDSSALLMPDPGLGVQLGVGGVAAAPVGPLAQLALRLLRVLMGNATRITAQAWNQLPGWAQAALTGIGFGIGVDLALDIPGIPGESGILGLGGGSGLPVHQVPHMVDGHIGGHMVGSWVANGVTFYRLSDGKLAVQNKHGRWKVWKPKKPIVIMPGGANNLKTLLRADAVLARQSKRIAAMLNRRAGTRRKSSPAAAKGGVVVVQDGKVSQT